MTEATNQSDDLTAISGDIDEPAIALFAPEADADAVAGTILRANREGLHVFVGHDGTESEAVEFARRLGATPVELPASEVGSQRERVRASLAERARDVGFPGILLHGTPGERLDFERSLDAVRRSTDYVVETTTKKTETDDIVVGIPAYNEEVGIGSVVLAARAFADRVVVVDDGSTDRTAEIARESGATVIEHETNRGKGVAIRDLLDYVAETDCEALVLIDGDGQHLPNDIPTVVDPVVNGDADLVIGSRYIEENDGETPRYRRVGQRVLDYLTMSSSKKKITDSQSGFRALSPRAIDELSLQADNFSIESEMIDIASQNELDIRERPIDVRYDGVDGQTQNPLRHGLEVVVFVLQLVRDRHPLLFFGLPGLIVTFAGVGYGLQGFILYQQSGQFYPVKVWVSGFLTLVGVLGLFIGLVLNSIANTIARRQEDDS